MPAQIVELDGWLVIDAGIQLAFTVAVQIPRPCVPAAIVLSLARYLIISVLTVGKVVLAVHTVAAPLIKSVSQTPVSVAINALVSVSG